MGCLAYGFACIGLGDREVKIMTRMTGTKAGRVLDFTTERGGAYEKNTVPRPPLERAETGICTMCGDPVRVAPGQLIKVYRKSDGTRLPMHKGCRKDFEKMK